MIDRREFTKLAALPLALTPEPTRASTAPRIKLGDQHGSSDEILRTVSSLGVTDICSSLPSPKFDENWSVESLTKLRERVESFGIRLAMVPLPMSSHPIATAEMPAIMLGQSPQRDRDIENIQQMIRNCARAGIPAAKYNMTILGVVRTGRAPGRGASTYSHFDYSNTPQQPPLTEAGPVDADTMWERITYFLTRVAPVAAEYKVRIACHPHDPAMPRPSGFRGIDRVLGSVEGLKRFISISENPYHGLNFCQGTVSEMLADPGKEIFDVIRYFGSRKKIFNVHFRNIRGGFLHFDETFPDAGSVDMLAALRVYQEVGYDGMLMPDHVPQIPGDTAGRQAFAFAFGYIRGLLQAVQG